jgi:hypothetical protein
MICCESYRLDFAHRQHAEADDARQPAKKSKKGEIATTQVGSTIADRYRFIFDFEEYARGVMNDSFVFNEMLWMHRNFIEEPMHKLGLPYCVWTQAAIEEHFDVNNGHIFDKVRELKYDLAQVRRLQNTLYAKCVMPSPGNPALSTVDAKSVVLYEKINKRKHSCIDALDRYQKEKASYANSGGRTIAIALSQGHLREPVTSNPQVAAGSMQRGGDALRTVGIQREENGQRTLKIFGGF